MSLIESDLAELKEHLLHMGGEVESMIERAMRSLNDRDSTLAEEVLADDDGIDLLELEGDQTCVRVLALKSPEARDLRFVISAAKLTPILERIADHACNVARAALELNNEPQLKPYIDLTRMSEVARGMLRDSLEAFAASDAVAARAVIERDDEIDTLYHTIFHDLLDIMAEDPTAAARAARLVLVAKHLERIGDYVTDICELIVFMKEALVIKHMAELTKQ
jgi:phosphate transport system protein